MIRWIVVLAVTALIFQNCAANYGFTGASSKTSGLNTSAGTPGTGGTTSPIVHETCTTDGTQTLYAGQYHNVGLVAVSIKNGSLQVVITLKPGIVMNEVHINVGSTLQSTAGSPGQFIFVKENLGWVSTYIATIPLTNFEVNNIAPLFVAVHAVVAPNAGLEGEIINGQETAWADGARPGAGWETVFQYAPAGCPTDSVKPE